MKSASYQLHRALVSLLTLAMIGIPPTVFAQTAAAPDQPSQPAIEQAAPPAAAANSQQPAASDQSTSQPQSNRLPDSPGAVLPQSAPPPRSTERPLGTAAAEIGNASGTAASKPAGVAIAPAKQRQSRSFLIKLGAAVGVGVAVGTVMALSSASPSRPPGSH